MWCWPISFLSTCSIQKSGYLIIMGKRLQTWKKEKKPWYVENYYLIEFNANYTQSGMFNKLLKN